jgi:hypothetical protein
MARLGSNQRPLACEAIYLGRQILRFAGGNGHKTARPSPSGHHEFQGFPGDLGQRPISLAQKRGGVPGRPLNHRRIE